MSSYSVKKHNLDYDGHNPDSNCHHPVLDYDSCSTIIFQVLKKVTTRGARGALYASHGQDQSGFIDDIYEHIQRFNQTLVQIDVSCDCSSSDSDASSDESDSESDDEDKAAHESLSLKKRFRPDRPDPKLTS